MGWDGIEGGTDSSEHVVLGDTHRTKPTVRLGVQHPPALCPPCCMGRTSSSSSTTCGVGRGVMLPPSEKEHLTDSLLLKAHSCNLRDGTHMRMADKF